MFECKEKGCLHLQTTCVTCGRLVIEKILPKPQEWIRVKERKPTPKDSPILAFDSDAHFSMAALHYLDDGWDGPGWYDHSDEYGMGLNENEAHFHEYGGMIAWMPLPELTEG